MFLINIYGKSWSWTSIGLKMVLILSTETGRTEQKPPPRGGEKSNRRILMPFKEFFWDSKCHASWKVATQYYCASSEIKLLCILCRINSCRCLLAKIHLLVLHIFSYSAPLVPHCLELRHAQGTLSPSAHIKHWAHLHRDWNKMTT